MHTVENRSGKHVHRAQRGDRITLTNDPTAAVTEVWRLDFDADRETYTLVTIDRTDGLNELTEYPGLGGFDTIQIVESWEQPDTEDCLDHGDLELTCSGDVEFRTPLSGTGRSFPRCDSHWAKRLDVQDGINRRYPEHQPADFDPAYAGESWYED